MINLLARLRRAGLVLIVGILLIVYVAIGIVFIQQGPRQRDLAIQINKLNELLSRPLPSAEKLQARYDKVKLALHPSEVPAVLDIIVGFARESGIDVTPDTNRLNIPPPNLIDEQKVGKGIYQVLRFSGIRVQGENDSVMSFIAKFDSGEKRGNFVLVSVSLSETAIPYTGEEETRRKEYREVSSAVTDMMTGNNLSSIPNPKDFAGGKAVNDMTVFPDSTSEWTGSPGGKTTDPDGTSYAASDKAGYILYGHDIKGDGAQTGPVNYATMTETTYFYTCEADGTVRQFDGPDVSAATEYLDFAEARTETIAVLGVDIYQKSL